MSARRRMRLRHHGNPFSVRGPIAAPELATWFGRSAPVAVDIGFGMGSFTLELARRHPEWNVLGIEIRGPLVARLKSAATDAGLTNLRALIANANLHLDTLLPPRSVIFVALNFPDPWYKKRHHKRRVVRPEWLRMLAGLLLPGAAVHVATDFEPLALEIAGMLRDSTDFISPDPGFAPENTTGMMSEREVKHLRRGDPIYRLRFHYQPDKAPVVSSGIARYDAKS